MEVLQGQHYIKSTLSKELRARENRSESGDAQAMLDSLPPEEALRRLNEMLAKNTSRQEQDANPKRVVLQLADIWQGPQRVARCLLEQDLPFTEEHRDIVALIAEAMQTAFDTREDVTSIRLPCDAALLHIIVLGGGGCGKTVMLTKLVFPLFEVYF